MYITLPMKLDHVNNSTKRFTVPFRIESCKSIDFLLARCNLFTVFATIVIIMMVCSDDCSKLKPRGYLRSAYIEKCRSEDDLITSHK